MLCEPLVQAAQAAPGELSSQEESISRRTFLKASTAAGGGLLLSIAFPGGLRLASAAGASTADDFAPNAFLRIGRDGRIALIVCQVEMGQGTYTSMPMLIAEELEVELSQVHVEHAPPDDRLYANPLIGFQVTGGSTSVRAFWKPLREAGAAARMLLVDAAAQAWGVEPSSCHAGKGYVIHNGTGRMADYGALAKKAATLPVPAADKIVLKDPKDFTLIGTPAKRLDTPDKVNGKAQFGIDVRLPGLKIAAIAICPVPGGKLKAVNEAKALAVKGVHQVVRLDDAVAVVADHMGAARKGLAALDIEWDAGPNAKVSTADIVRELDTASQKPGAIARKDGDVEKALGGAAKKIEAVYQVPFLAHATMEPMNCTVHLQKDRCDVWAPTQGPLVAKMVASQVAGMAPDKVHVHTTLLGCGLGRRAAPDFIVEGVILSKAAGKPVKLVWSREEDIQHDLFRPATCQRITAGLDAEGRLTAWSHKVVTPSLMKDIEPKAVVNGVDFMSLWGLADFPGSPDNNNIAYEIPNFFLEFLIDDLPIPVAPWRSVQNAPNAFVTESFIDELAAAAGKDPLAFRLGLLKRTCAPAACSRRPRVRQAGGRPRPGAGRWASPSTRVSAPIWPRWRTFP